LDPEYGKGYRELYERHWWWRSREVAVLSVLHRHRGSASPARILDIGCGDGLFFRALEEFGEAEGLESSAALLSPHGPYRARIHVAPFDARFRSGKEYDLILMLDVLEHLDNPAEALRLAASLLPPGGSLLLTVPAFRLLWTNHDLINHHRTRYRRGTLRPLLKEAGFLVVDQRYWYQWTCPVKLAQRFVEGLFRLPPALPAVPPHWLNTLLYRLSRFEQETLGAWGVPFGSSLMMYCRKANR
jgi:SAM-dependent methyltransferase